MCKDYNSLIQEMYIDNSNYLAIDKLQHNLATINVELLNKTDDKNICTLIATIGILEKIKECNATSATKCFTCINQINRGDLLWVKNLKLKSYIIKKEKRR